LDTKTPTFFKWIEEKTRGEVPPSQVRSVSVESLRLKGPEAVIETVRIIPKGGILVINAVDYRDLEFAVLGLLEAEVLEKRFIYRTAASFVKSRQV
jgi:2-phosphoglycerate kinase